jgi:hypothetical protein
MTMCVNNTPVEYHDNLGLYVKREDLSCPDGPHFSKTRGVYAWVANRPESVIGVLDTSHSQGGHAVARACHVLGKQCRLFYPVRKAERDHAMKPQQVSASLLGAEMIPLPAGRSAVLYHQAKKQMNDHGIMIPNALKLDESVVETAAEVDRTIIPPDISAVIISASSGTIAAGVIRGLADAGVHIVVHMGYSRSEAAVRRYLTEKAGWTGAGDGVTIIDEQYSYADSARMDFDVIPDFPCNQYYDLKAWRWWVKEGQARYGKALFWNVG